MRPIRCPLYDSLSILGHGLLPKELTNESLKVIHKSVPRNPLVAGICFKAGYIDSWGRGTTKIISECLKKGLPEAQLIEFQGGFLLRGLRAHLLLRSRGGSSFRSAKLIL